MARSIDFKVTVDGKSLEELTKALKKLSASGSIAAAGLSGMGGAIKKVANSYNTRNMQAGKSAFMVGEVVSREEFKKLADKYGRCSQRMSLLLSLIGGDELKRLGLLPADAVLNDEVDGWDRVQILKALDDKVDQFNAAHQRLTGKRKKVLDPGRIELTQEEMATVFAAKSAGLSTEKILQAIKDKREGKTIRL